MTIEESGPLPMMVISEDKREILIDIDLSVDFEIDNALREVSIYSEEESTNVTSYISSCKCGGMKDFKCNTDALLTNTELFVCIKSISSNVEVDFLESMVSSWINFVPFFTVDVQTISSYS